MYEYDESDWFQISALNRFLFCPRQFALVHIEGEWAENVHTFTGHLLHERTHDPEYGESRGNKLIRHAMRVFSPELGVSGECDTVEFLKSDTGITLADKAGLWAPVPVEYKKGADKGLVSDRAQLCCQAMCLEEMLCCEIQYGYLYYFETRRRTRIEFDSELRSLVKDSLVRMHELYEKRHTPVVKKQASCKACSLYHICMPVLSSKKSVSKYMDEYIKI